MKRISIFLLSLLFALCASMAAVAQSSKVIAGVTRTVCVVPTITASTYTNVQPIGGLLTFSGALGSLGSGVLQSVSVTSKSLQTASLTFYPLIANPTASTLADHGTAAINTADVQKVRTPVLLTGPLSGLGTHTIWGAVSLGQAISVAPVANQNVTTLYGVLLPQATTAAFALLDVQVCVQVMGDN